MQKINEALFLKAKFFLYALSFGSVIVIFSLTIMQASESSYKSNPSLNVTNLICLLICLLVSRQIDNKLLPIF